MSSYFPKTGRSEKSHIELNIVETMAEGFRDHTPNAMLTKDIDRQALCIRIAPHVIHKRGARPSTYIHIKVPTLNSRGSKKLCLWEGSFQTMDIGVHRNQIVQIEQVSLGSKVDTGVRCVNIAMTIMSKD